MKGSGARMFFFSTVQVKQFKSQNIESIALFLVTMFPKGPRLKFKVKGRNQTTILIGLGMGAFR